MNDERVYEISREIADRLVNRAGDLEEGPIVIYGVGYRVEIPACGAMVTHMWKADSPELYCSVEDYPEQMLHIAIEGDGEWPAGSALAECDPESAYFQMKFDIYCEMTKDAMVIQDGSGDGLEAALLEKVKQVTGVLANPRDINAAIYGDKYSIAVHMA